MTVPVTFARRDIARRGDRRAGFTIAAPMTALVPSSPQRGGQFLFNQLFDEAPNPIPIPASIGSDQASPRNSVPSSAVVVLSIVMA